MPKVSIGVPLYNAASMVAESLEGVLSQTFGDWEAVISDNASEDETLRIVQRYAARDDRFRVIRQPRNLGPIANFRAVLQASTAPYFMWRSYDDVFSADYVERLAGRLDADPRADLAAPHVETIRLISGRRRPRSVSMLEAGRSSAAKVLRYSQAGWIYGLWRREAIGPVFDMTHEVLAPDVWTWDHLALFPSIVGGRVRFDDAARLTLRLTEAGHKKGWNPDDKRRRRDLIGRYWRECQRIIEREQVPLARRPGLNLALLRHINRQVMPLRRLI